MISVERRVASCLSESANDILLVFGRLEGNPLGG